MLDQEQLGHYASHQWLALPHFFSAAEMDQLKQAAAEIIDAFDPASTSAIFTTRDHTRTRDAWFLGSADKIRCFFEEDAFDDTGGLRQEKSLSINKIGHALHTLHPVFRAFSHDPRIAELARDLGLARPQIHQSMYIFKQPRIGGEVNWHQDASFFLTRPISVTTFWVAIEDATVDNGCLQVPNEAQAFPLTQQFIRHPDDTTEMRQLCDVAWPALDAAQPLEIEKGGLVVFTGLLPHFSAPNTSDRSRHAYTLHVTCADTEYAAENWIQAPASPL